MNDNLPENIAGALGTGLPVLLLQFVICIVLLIIGVAIYTLVTPFRERELLRHGNVAAATVLSGAAVALASQSLRDLRIAEVSQLDLQLEGGRVVAYRAKVKVSFKYEGGD